MRFCLIRYLTQLLRRPLMPPLVPCRLHAAALATGFFVGVAALAACGPLQATEDDALARLRALSAASVCRQAADCRTVPVGVKACGGPAAYIAVAQADLPAAQALAQRHLQLRLAQRRTQPEPPSTCNVVQDPGAQCVENRCVIGAGGNGDVSRVENRGKPLPVGRISVSVIRQPTSSMGDRRITLLRS